MKASREIQGRQFPMSLNEVVLVHMFNLSSEIVRDGLMKEYEPAVDRIMYWLYAEFKAHPEFLPRFNEVMNRQFGNPGISDKDRGLRIRDKEMLLSELLYAHKVNLGGGKGVQFERAGEQDYKDILESDDDEVMDGGHPPETRTNSADPFAE